MYTSTYYIKLKAISPQTQRRYVTMGLFFKLFCAWSSHIYYSIYGRVGPSSALAQLEKAPEFILSVVVYETWDIILNYFNQCLILLSHSFSIYKHFYVSKCPNKIVVIQLHQEKENGNKGMNFNSVFHFMPVSQPDKNIQKTKII